MSTNYLNIDKLAQVKKTLEIEGVVHEMHQVSVAEFIKIVRESREIDEKSFEELSLDARVSKMVDNVLLAFPTIPREALEALTIDQLITVVKFVSGNLEEEAQARASLDEKNG